MWRGDELWFMKATFPRDVNNTTTRRADLRTRLRPDHTTFQMTPPTTPHHQHSATAAVDSTPAARVFDLSELCGEIAKYCGVVGAWRLTGVNRACRQGVKSWLSTLPRLVVCGGYPGHGTVGTSAVWRLDLVELRWDRMPNLSRGGRFGHACCALKGNVVVIGGCALGGDIITSVEIFGCDDSVEDSDEAACVGRNGSHRDPLPLSCGPQTYSTALEIQEGTSDQDQVLLIGGFGRDRLPSSAVQKVDLATGVCTSQPPLLSQHDGHTLRDCTSARLPDGRIVCVGKNTDFTRRGTAQIMEPSPLTYHGSPGDSSWRWRYLPDMSVGRGLAGSCVLSDGRFAVFGGSDHGYAPMTSCQVLTLNGDVERWDTLPPMHEARKAFACASIGGCVIVAGGDRSLTAEVYEEALGRWRRLPCNLPHLDDAMHSLFASGSALM